MIKEHAEFISGCIQAVAGICSVEPGTKLLTKGGFTCIYSLWEFSFDLMSRRDLVWEVTEFKFLIVFLYLGFCTATVSTKEKENQQWCCF